MPRLAECYINFTIAILQKSVNIKADVYKETLTLQEHPYEYISKGKVQLENSGVHFTYNIEPHRLLTAIPAAAAAAAKLLQSCPTLCDPIDGSLPGSLVLGILQARVLEWGAIAFSEE